MPDLPPDLLIPEAELDWSYARSGGPGGQNVNKVSSKATLRWNPAASPSLAPPVKARFLTLYAARLTTEGELLVTSEKTRDQGRNRDDCRAKLAVMIRRATAVPKARKKTRPSRGSQLRRLAAKKQRSATKQSRRGGADE